MIGQGYQNCIIPTFLQNHFFRNPHIYTPYTPYQAEISQGRLEMLHNYQSIVSTILNKDISVASLLDSGQVGMDIITIMKKKSKKNIILVQDTCFQTFRNCLNLRAKHQEITLIPFSIYDTHLSFDTSILDKTAGIIIQTPDTHGLLISTNILESIKEYNPEILIGCNTDLMTHIHYDLQKLTEICDFLFGNGGNMGVGLNYGGPQPAFLASSKEYVRDLPGKIVGKSKCIPHNNDGYRLSLQTREQHIKREKATSNICTNQALLANLSGAWMMYHGNDGLKNIAQSIYEKTKYISQNICDYRIRHHTDYFNTLSLNNNDDLYEILLCNNIHSYLNDKNNTVSITIDQTHTHNDIEKIVDIINNINIKRTYNKSIFIDDAQFESKRKTTAVPKNLDYFSHSSQPEQNLSRYLHNLSLKDYSMLSGLIPLGSCTMKYTPVDSMETVCDPSMNIHPYVPLKDTPYSNIISSLTDKLTLISGFDHIFYQSQSGAMGEYAGLSTIKNFHTKNSPDSHKDIVLMPKSAHGTNASTTTLCGYKIVHLKETKEGMIDMDNFHEIIHKYSSQIAALMITYPSTYGLFEKNISYMNHMIHLHGGLVYMDGANMNALMGKSTPSSLGFDVCHFNLHKTFAIPHGGGGPGMGPIGVTKELIPFLPTFDINNNVESISTAPYGSGLILQISEHYARQFDSITLTEFNKNILYRTQQIINSLKHDFNIIQANSEYRAHEFIIDCSEFKKYGITDVDISKRLMDYGFHAPTMSWPIRNSLMIEVTETESHEEIMRFVYALKQIKQEIITSPELLKNAPHTQYDVADWKYPYSIHMGCYPAGKHQINNKYWPTINRMNDVLGDKTLLSK
jgi:glycine dehydrogenase